MRTISPTRGVSAVKSTALSLLLARFVGGEIPETAWRRIMAVLDEGETTSEERVALVNFLNDACTELGPDSVEIPALGDVEDLVSLTRAA